MSNALVGARVGLFNLRLEPLLSAVVVGRQVHASATVAREKLQQHRVLSFIHQHILNLFRESWTEYLAILEPRDAGCGEAVEGALESERGARVFYHVLPVSEDRWRS